MVPVTEEMECNAFRVGESLLTQEMVDPSPLPFHCQEALLIVLEKAIQSCELIGGMQATGDVGKVVLTARACTQVEWGTHG